ncbi:MAG: hypothetical protein FJX77_05690 [Armatimonadetes bacterium]|nr:hypothetical protein [Armatimonadota bacterium]
MKKFNEQTTRPTVRRRPFAWTAALLGAVLLTVVAPTRAATVIRGFAETRIANGLSQPTSMQFAPDGRLFVCEQGGDVRIIKNGALLPAPFLRLDVDSRGERGLLGVAFDPDFVVNGFVYVYYTARTPAIHNRVSRFRAEGDVAAAGETIILDLNNLTAAQNHNGGRIQFGPDGKLYVATGDNTTGANSQNLTNLLGKLLRINRDGTIPDDNPFPGQTTGANRAIWALGLRNPYQFEFGPGTGRMFILDVGAADFEEINLGVAGANYGWPTTEGPTTDPRFRGPLFAYEHGDGTTRGRALTAGTFYNPDTFAFPNAFRNTFFFADLINGWVRNLSPDGATATLFATNLATPVDLKVGPDGNLYTLSYTGGEVTRISFAGLGSPDRLRATQVTGTRVDLAWDDHNSDETAFEIEVCSGTSRRFTRLGTVPANQTTFSALKLRNRTAYTFRVRALRPTGPTEYSNELAVTTPEGGKLLVSPTSLMLRAAAPRGEVVIRNTGRGLLAVTLELGPGPFVLLGAEPNFVLNPGAERRIQVEFQPAGGGAATATLTVRSDDRMRSRVTVRLRGR